MNIPTVSVQNTGNPNFSPTGKNIGRTNGPIQVTSSSPKKLSNGNIITIYGSSFNNLKMGDFLFLNQIPSDPNNNQGLIRGLLQLNSSNTSIVNDNELIFTADNSSFYGTTGRNFYVGFFYLLGSVFYQTNPSNNATLLVDIK